MARNPVGTVTSRRTHDRAIERVLVIAKRSAYDYYVRRYKMARVRELLRAKDPSVARLLRADRHHSATLAELREVLRNLGVRARFRDRSQMGSTEGFDLVITVGGDGTLLSASHACGDVPIFGINSAPFDSVGFLCSARQGNVRSRVRDAVQGRLPITLLSRMRVTVDGEVVHQRVLNDVLYAHRNPAMTARYHLIFRGVSEEHKSSGIWIGPAAGSTAAIRSAGGRVLSPRSRMIQFVVREPFHPCGGKFTWERGLVRPGEALEVLNVMREAALYIDGPRCMIPLEIGQRVRFDVSPEPLRVLGFSPGTSAMQARK
jgi:NAD+ kinase